MFKILPVLMLALALGIMQPVLALTQADNQAKEEIDNGLSKIAPSNIKTLTADTFDNKSIVIYNQSQAPPPSCPVGTAWNETSQKCDPIPPPPPTCPPGQFYNTTSHQCQDSINPPPPPPPPPVTDKPTKTFNSTTVFRVAAIGDIDNNAGLVTQLKLMNAYHVQLLIVIGDYGYNSCQGVVDKLNSNGFSAANAIIIQGNHDCSPVTKAFNGLDFLYGSKTYAGGKLEIFALDGNSALDCQSAQFTAMKSKIQSSDAWYNIAGVHQPFLTVKSTHGANGQFSCWDPLFRANGVNPVLEAHNHNYQRFDANGITYDLVGTGTHDTGSSMYPINSNTASGFPCLKCFTGTNGFALMDLAIADPNVKGMQGWFLSNDDTVKDSFH